MVVGGGVYFDVVLSGLGGTFFAADSATAAQGRCWFCRHCGVGTALPVIVFAILMVFANQYVARTFDKLSVVERWVRVGAGVIFIAAGIFYCLTMIYGVKLQ